jgi:hypothetical protein
MFLTGYEYRLRCQITTSIDAGTYYQVKLVIGEDIGSPASYNFGGLADHFPSAENNSGDFRITSSDGSTDLNFYIAEVSGSAPNRTATIWIRVAEQLNTTRYVYIYFNKTSYSNLSNGTNTFLSFDDFSNSVIGDSSDIWNILPGNGSITEASGKANISLTGTQNNRWGGGFARESTALQLKTMPVGDWRAEIELDSFSITDLGQAGIAAYQDDSNAYIFGKVKFSVPSPTYGYGLGKIIANISSAIAINTTTTEPARLVIQRVGGSYSFYVSFDGTTYIQVGLTYSDLTFNNIVLFGREMGSNDLFVDFDNFNIRKYITPEPIISAQEIEAQSAEYAKALTREANKLYVACNTNPIKLVEVDISSTPIFAIYSLSKSTDVGTNANDLTINETWHDLMMACSNGIAARISTSNLSNRTYIDTTETENLNFVSSDGSQHISYVATENTSTDELIRIDDYKTTPLSFDFRYANNVSTFLGFRLRVTSAKSFGFDFRYANNVPSVLGFDFRYSPYTHDTIPYIKRTDFLVKIDGSEETKTVLSSIRITKIVDDKNSATFTIAKKFDEWIPNQNDVEIYIKGKLEFKGYIETYTSSQENVTVQCLAYVENDVPTVRKLILKYAGATIYRDVANINSVILSLPTLNQQLHIYDILDMSPTIYNPLYDIDDEEPKFYRGVILDLGTKEQESVVNDLALPDLGSVQDIYAQFIGGESFGLDVALGNWQPVQNYTYFWLASGYDFIRRESFEYKYIGTSSSGLGSQFIEIGSLFISGQRIFDNVKTELGNYAIGQAPYRSINVDKKGEYYPVFQLEDREDGLYLVKHASYNYTQYAKAQAAMEYAAMKNINGTVMPQTSATFKVSIDAYQYYNMQPLTRINVDNTTTPNVYNKNNGFPVSIKQLDIDAGTMSVSLSTDNKYSVKELELLRGGFAYSSTNMELAEYARRLYVKFDISTLEDIAI